MPRPKKKNSDTGAHPGLKAKLGALLGSSEIFGVFKP